MANQELEAKETHPTAQTTRSLLDSLWRMFDTSLVVTTVGATVVSLILSSISTAGFNSMIYPERFQLGGDLAVFAVTCAAVYVVGRLVRGKEII